MLFACTIHIALFTKHPSCLIKTRNHRILERVTPFLLRMISALHPLSLWGLLLAICSLWSLSGQQPGIFLVCTETRNHRIAEARDPPFLLRVSALPSLALCPEGSLLRTQFHSNKLIFNGSHDRMSCEYPANIQLCYFAICDFAMFVRYLYFAHAEGFPPIDYALCSYPRANSARAIDRPIAWGILGR